MIRKFRCNNLGNYQTLTIDKVYEGTFDENSGLVTITTDKGYKERIYASRFDDVTDNNAILKLLKEELQAINTTLMDKAKEISLLRKKIEEEETPTVGSQWKVKDDGEHGHIYIVADVGDAGYVLISTTNGMRWADPMKDITKIFGTYYKFVKVK